MTQSGSLPVRPRLRRMLEGRTVAVVGASERPDSFGWRMATEVLRSPGIERSYLVHPTRHRARPAVRAVPGRRAGAGRPGAARRTRPRAASSRCELAAARGDGGAVVFGAAHGLPRGAGSRGGRAWRSAAAAAWVSSTRHAASARSATWSATRCPPGPIALVTHSGSVFSAMLRTHRRLEYSRRGLVGPGAGHHDRRLPRLRAVPARDAGGRAGARDAARRRRACAAASPTAAERDVPVVALTVGTSSRGRALVDAHSGALAGSDAAWEALFSAYGVHRRRRPRRARRQPRGVRHRPAGPRGGPAASPPCTTRGPSGSWSPTWPSGSACRSRPCRSDDRRRLADLLDPGLAPTNPLDVWGTGADTEDLLRECLTALADDDAVDVVALAVDLVPEYDGDESFPQALDRLVDHTDKPVAVLSQPRRRPIDQPLAAELRARGIPVLEGTRSGLRALGHLLATRHRRPARRPGADEERHARWSARLRGRRGRRRSRCSPTTAIPVVDHRGRSTTAEAAVAAADAAGYPVVLKTADPDIHHKLDVDGVRLGLGDSDAVAAAYADLAARLGPTVSVQPQVPDGRGGRARPVARPAARPARAGRGRRLAGRAAGRARGRAAAGGRRHRLGAWSSRLRLSELLAGHRGRPARRHRWPGRRGGRRSRSSPTSSATCSRRSTSTRWSSDRPASWRSTHSWCRASPPRESCPGVRSHDYRGGLSVRTRTRGTGARSGRAPAGCGRARRSGPGRGR